MTGAALLITCFAAAVTPNAAGAFVLRSSAFAAGAAIPSRFSCEGEDLSPPLTWDAAPSGTKCFALIVDDPDAPDPAHPRPNPWVHWVLYNLPASTNALAAGVTVAALPSGTRVGSSDRGKASYHGPCPPTGRHRYIFKLYALDVVLPDLGAANKAALEHAMTGHILGSAELIGTYVKGG